MGPAAEPHAHTQGPAPETLLAVELPHVEEPAPVLAYAGAEASPEERKGWGIIEID